MNTNGAVQSTFFWHALGKLFNKPNDYCVFSIDGLEDTNGIYRKNVNWAKVMANAESFISAGGYAHWDMLVYKHNQHQVDECEQLARDMGFKWFRAKVSKRPMIAGLEAPINWQQPDRKSGAVRCHAVEEKSEYVDARGRKIPCCWLGNSVVDPITDIETVKATWKTETPNPICARNCSVNKNQTVFQDQWQREIELAS
jgi:sulfatase maturation enzyme AslB (radical SAM superfamily)